MFSCGDDESDSNIDDKVTEENNGNVTGHYFTGDLEGRQITIKDESLFAVTAVISSSSTPESPDSVLLSYGTEFRITNSSDEILETFLVEFRIAEAKANLDKNNNYKDPSYFGNLITLGDYDYYYHSAKETKSVSISYTNLNQETERYYTQSFSEKIFDYSTFNFQLTHIVMDYVKEQMIVIGELKCQMYNIDDPNDIISLGATFQAPIKYTFPE